MCFILPVSSLEVESVVKVQLRRSTIVRPTSCPFDSEVN
jgi:hypothetical protein